LTNTKRRTKFKPRPNKGQYQMKNIAKNIGYLFIITGCGGGDLTQTGTKLQCEGCGTGGASIEGDSGTVASSGGKGTGGSVGVGTGGSVVSSGGSVSTGGVVGTGGVTSSSTGGASAGGTFSTGGISSAGGITGSGGQIGSGGLTSSGGSGSSSCDPPTQRVDCVIHSGGNPSYIGACVPDCSSYPKIPIGGIWIVAGCTQLPGYRCVFCNGYPCK
jgi:hypothetical protein